MNRTAEIEKAREVDTRIAAEWEAYYNARYLATEYAKQIERAQGQIERWGARQPGLVESNTRLIERKQIEIAEQQALMVKHSEKANEIEEAEYTGWSRFFLVQHIHSNRNCSSFRPTTRVGWLPSVSGLTEREAVAEHGETLCTICFPSAPVELTTKQADPSLCSGSGKHYDTEHLTGRENAYSSPAGYCPVCGRWNTITKTRVMRKHKEDTTRRHWSS